MTRSVSPAPAVAVLAVAFVVQAFASARLESSTWDETHYFGLGRYLLETGRWDVAGAILHPPLSYYLNSLPLLFADLPADAFRRIPPERRTLDALGEPDLVRGRTLLASPANAGNCLLLASRAVMILVGAIGAVLVYAFARALYGVPAGLLAEGLYAFHPDLLAHARLITPDIALTVSAFGATFFLWRTLASERRRDALASGYLLGLALLSKFTALLFVPVFALLFAPAPPGAGRRRAVHALVVFATAAAVLLLGYRFDLTPWLEGIAFQRADVAAGHPAFLMGRTSDHGWWYAIPVALALKTPIALLLLLAAAALRLASQWDRSRWRAAAFLLLPALAVIGFFSLRQASIGLRYVLPAVPFLLVFASGVLAPVPRARPARAVLLGLLSWYVGASLFIHPHYLAYFNEIAGGPSRGYRLLVDSNLDWGQDLPGLAQFMRERGVESVHLSYFGSDAPARYGIRYDWLPSFELERPASQSETELPRRGWFAISATNLQGLYLPQPETFAWLREREPVAEIGYSIFVYHVE